MSYRMLANCEVNEENDTIFPMSANKGCLLKNESGCMIYNLLQVTDFTAYKPNPLRGPTYSYQTVTKGC